ncbi:MAG: prepilin peptidase [Mariniblastus sp.]|nr:prepilin peptidase [Mariniblastus sp.]
MGHPPWKAIKQAGCLLGSLAVFFLIVLPLTISTCIQWIPNPSGSLSEYLRWIESAQRYSFSLFAAIWFFLLGSCFASFLNVIAWRAARGRSILGHSSCPYCHRRLGPWDNFPVLGWLRNDGHCITCQAPISPRYLMVEVILGSVFMLVALATLTSGGITLPIRPPHDGGGFVQLLFDPKWDLIQIVAGQLCLLLFLFAFALVDLERFPIPRSILITGMLTGIGLSFVAPDMFLVNYKWPWANPYPAPAGQGNLFLTLLTGTIVGGLCGITLNRLWGKRINPLLQWPEMASAQPFLPGVAEPAIDQEKGTSTTDHPLVPGHPSADAEKNHSVPTSFLYGFLLCGLYLGWQSALVISLWVTLLVFLLPSRIEWGRCSLKTANSLLFTACIFHLMTWRWMNWLSH